MTDKCSRSAGGAKIIFPEAWRFWIAYPRGAATFWPSEAQNFRTVDYLAVGACKLCNCRQLWGQRLKTVKLSSVLLLRRIEIEDEGLRGSD